MTDLNRDDPQVAELVAGEKARLENTLDLIAAENYPPASVLEAQGSVFGIKAAEGYPGRRFHAGCRLADGLERLAVERAKMLFGAEHANVQPHSGVSANLAVYFAVLELGDRVLAMKLSHGGHLSHGDPASITSRCFCFRHYGVKPENECIDFDALSEAAAEFNPRLIVAGASSYSRLIDYDRIARIARGNGAMLLVDMAHIAGLVAAKVIPSPVPVSDFVTFTTYKTLMGGRGGVILCRAQYADRIDRTLFPAAQGTPALNQVAAKAVCFKLAQESKFIGIQQQILRNAAGAAREFAARGFRVVAGGTENHLVLLDLRPKGVNGLQAERVLESVGIITNRNVIPYDPEKPDITSGLRLGFSAVSVRGMKHAEIETIVQLIDRALCHPDDLAVLDDVADEVCRLCRRFPYDQTRY